MVFLLWGRQAQAKAGAHRGAARGAAGGASLAAGARGVRRVAAVLAGERGAGGGGPGDDELAAAGGSAGLGGLKPPLGRRLAVGRLCGLPPAEAGLSPVQFNSFSPPVGGAPRLLDRVSASMKSERARRRRTGVAPERGDCRGVGGRLGRAAWETTRGEAAGRNGRRGQAQGRVLAALSARRDDARRMGGAVRRLRQVLPAQARGCRYRRGRLHPHRLPAARRGTCRCTHYAARKLVPDCVVLTPREHRARLLDAGDLRLPARPEGRALFDGIR